MELITDDQTAPKQLILRPEEGSILDHLRFLFKGDTESQQFIDTIQKKERILEQRGIIFLSTEVQRILKKLSRRLFSFGSCVEMWLNLLSTNDNLPKLALNYFNGDLVKPDKDSARFKSTIGCLDQRVDLDNNIKPGDNRYFGALSAVASKLAYENKAFIKATVEDRWKMKLLRPDIQDFWNDYQKKFTTQGFMFHNKNGNRNMIIVAFRGTEPFDADSWSSDVDISWYKYEGVGKVHYGFMKALGLQRDETWHVRIRDSGSQPTAFHTIRDELKQNLEMDSQTRFILTGHSLGGALAVLFPAVVALNGDDKILERLEAVYTFGQPRVGDEKFGGFMTELFRRYGVKYYRFVYSHDIVPRLPFDNSTMMFKHFGTCVYYNSVYEGKIVEEEPMKNYFSVKSFVTKRVDAVWELVRSFLLPRMYGPYYKEGCPLRAIRMFGLLFPGVPAHAPQDYINALHLGNHDVFH